MSHKDTLFAPNVQELRALYRPRSNLINAYNIIDYYNNHFKKVIFVIITFAKSSL